MNKIALLVLFMLFAFCGTSHADVVTLADGSVFEGTVYEEDQLGYSFRVDGGIIVLLHPFVVSVENRTPTENERGRLIRFKTKRYDVTEESADSMTIYEEDVLEESRRNSDTFDDAHVKIVAEKLDLPPIIVEMIFIKAWRPW